MAAEPDHELRRRAGWPPRAGPRRLCPHLTTTARLQSELEPATDGRATGPGPTCPPSLATAGRLALETAVGDHAQELGRLAEAVEADQTRAELQAAHAEAVALGAAAGRSAQAARAEAALADRAANGGRAARSS